METNMALMNEALAKLMNAIAASDGIRVKFDRDCPQPRATADRTVYMPPPSIVDGLKYWYYAMHELGHLMKPLEWSYTELHKKINQDDKLVQALANILMDNLCEHGLFGMYEGVDNILDEGRSSMVREDWYKHTTAELKKLEAHPIHNLLMGLLIEDYDQRKSWMSHHMNSLDLSKYDGMFMDIRSGLRKLKYAQRIDGILVSPRPAHACAELIKDILKLIGYDPPPNPKGEDEDEGEGEGEGSGKCESCGGTGEQPTDANDGTMETCEACGGTGEANGKTVSGDTEDDGKREPTDGDWEMTEANEKHNPDGIGTGHDSAKGQNFDQAGMDIDLEATIKALNADLLKRLENEPERREVPRWDRSAPYVPWDRMKVHELEATHTQFRDFQRRAIELALGSSTVSKQVSKYLKALVSESYTYGQKRGKIHMKNMHRIISQKPMPGTSPSIFKKRNSSVLKTDTAVTLLVDCSGSMGGSKYATAAACVVALSETLTAIQVPHEILGFTESYGLTHYVFKNFSTTLTKEKLLNIMASDKINMNNNADGESLHWAAQRLLRRKESRKLLIVLSDGAPAGSFTGDGQAYLKQVAETIENESPIDLVGIGILTRAPERFYKNHIVVTHTEELDTTLFGLLKKFLI